MSKYKIWHDQLIERARLRKPLGCYSERHHIRPRSLGGSDDPYNLVDLTYREHFLIHWILTKIYTDGELRKAQQGLFAVTIPVSSGRVVKSWQMDVVGRLVGNLAIDPVAEAQWRKNYTVIAIGKENARRDAQSAKFQEKLKARKAARERLEQLVASKQKVSDKELKDLADQILRQPKRNKNSWRPRRMIGPDGTVRSRQKIKLKHPEFLRADNAADTNS